jgi:hypothetical protein
MKKRPAWWDWDLEVSEHVLDRMDDRDFTEIDVRSMLMSAQTIRSDIVAGRWIVSAFHQRRRWEIILEPDIEERVLVVVTAYPVTV